MISDALIRPRVFIADDLSALPLAVGLRVLLEGSEIGGSPFRMDRVLGLPGIFASAPVGLAPGAHQLVWTVDGAETRSAITVDYGFRGECEPGARKLTYVGTTGWDDLKVALFDVLDSFAPVGEELSASEITTGVYTSDSVALREGVYLAYWYRDTILSGPSVARRAGLLRCLRAHARYEVQLTLADADDTALEGVTVTALAGVRTLSAAAVTDAAGEVVFSLFPGVYHLLFSQTGKTFTVNMEKVIVEEYDMTQAVETEAVDVPADLEKLPGHVTMEWSVYDLQGNGTAGDHVVEVTSPQIAGELVQGLADAAWCPPTGRARAEVPTGAPFRLYTPLGVVIEGAAEAGNPFEFESLEEVSYDAIEALPTLPRSSF